MNMNKQSNITVDTQTMIRFWLIPLLITAVIAGVYMMSTALTIIGIALFLAVILNPSVNRIAKLLPGKSRILSTALAYVAVVAVLGLVVTLVLPPIVGEIAKVGQALPQLVNQATTQYKGLGNLITQYNLQPQVDSLLASISSSASNIAGFVGQNIWSSIGSVFNIGAATFLTLVLSFLMLIEGPAWLQYIWKLYKNKSTVAYHQAVLKRMYNVITGFATGQITVASIAGVVAGLFIAILALIFPDVSIGLAIPMGALILILSLVPMFGALVCSVLITFVLLLSSLPAAIAFLIFYLLYQQVEGNYISPHIQSKHIELTPLMILIAVTIGLYLFGIAGGIVSIPAAGIVKVLLDEYIHYRRALSQEAKA